MIGQARIMGALFQGAILCLSCFLPAANSWLQPLALIGLGALKFGPDQTVQSQPLSSSVATVATSVFVVGTVCSKKDFYARLRGS